MIIKNARALETNHLPQDLQHRDGKIDQLANALRPIEGGVSGEHSMVFGPSGCGKTTLAKFVARKLRETTFDVRRAYWNCAGGSRKTDVLHGLVQDADLGPRIPSDGVSASRYIEEFRKTDDQILVIIDEVDELEDKTTLLALADLSNVTIVLITTDEDRLFSDPEFGGRFKSRFFGGGEKLRLSLYLQSELEDILWFRIEHGLAPGVIEPEVVSHMAQIADGNARNAIKLLRRAAKDAYSRSASKITINDVEGIRQEAAEDSRAELVGALGTHKRRLYDIIEEAGEISASDLTARYKREAIDPRSRSSRNRYLKSLEEKYGLIKSEGTTKGTVYSVTDP